MRVLEETSAENTRVPRKSIKFVVHWTSEIPFMISKNEDDLYVLVLNLTRREMLIRVNPIIKNS